MTPGMAADDIVTGRIWIHYFKKYFLYARAFFIYGVVERIDETVYAFFNLLFVHTVCRCHVVSQQFVAVVGKSFELDALGVSKKEHIYSLVYGLKLHLAIVVCENKPIVFRYPQMAQFALCRLDAQLFQYWYADGVEQQVCPLHTPQLICQ